MTLGCRPRTARRSWRAVERHQHGATLAPQTSRGGNLLGGFEKAQGQRRRSGRQFPKRSADQTLPRRPCIRHQPILTDTEHNHSIQQALSAQWLTMSARLFTVHPKPLTVLYGDIEAFAHSQPQVLLGTAGSLLVRRNAAGFEFYARQFYDGDGKKREAYVAGPVGSPDAEETAAALRGQMQEVKALTADLRLLGREGFQLADAKTYATLATLSNAGLFRAGAVLVGSHAYGILLNQLGIRSAVYTTEDIDVARRQPLALAEPLSMDLLSLLRTSGIEFVAVPGFHPGEPATSFKQVGRSRFQVDLLVPAAGEEIGLVAVPELGAHATALPWLRYLLAESQLAPVLAREGCCQVRVPLPERLALHKVLVSRLRTGRSAKSQKDLDQAAVLLAALAELHPGAVAAAAAALPAAVHSRVAQGCSALAGVLGGQHERAWMELTEAGLVAS